MQRRVVITGVGLVTPLATGVDETWQGVLAGKSGIGRIQKFDTSALKCQIAGEVLDFNPEDWMNKKLVRRVDTFIQYAIAAGVQAWAMSGLPEPLAPEQAARAGCIMGVGLGGMHTLETTVATLEAKGPDRVSPFFIPRVIGNMAPGEIAMRFQLWGPNLCITTACAAGAHAVGEAYCQIKRGIIDTAVAGGAESVITTCTVAGFTSARTLSLRNDEPERASRPFEKDRDGFVMAEGSGVLVLEELETAKARGANILAELVGFGLTCDAYHMTAPEPEGRGFILCMNQALDDAGLKPESIDYINAHGTSTELNDSIETKAIKGVFGDHAYKLAVSSTKSMLGHSLGATGGMEAAISTLALRDQVMPPTINYETPDPECDLDYVPNQKRPAELNYVMTNSFGFGGTNASLILARYQGD